MATSCISRSMSWSWETTIWACSICLSGMNPCWIRVRCASTSLCVLKARRARVYRGLTINSMIWTHTFFYVKAAKNERECRTFFQTIPWRLTRTIPTTQTTGGSQRITFMPFFESMDFRTIEFKTPNCFRRQWSIPRMCVVWSIQLRTDVRPSWFPVHPE